MNLTTYKNSNVVSLQANISNSGLLLIEVTTTNGFFRNKIISGVTVAPNPASDFINLLFVDPKKYSALTIYNALGQLVQTNHLNGEIYQNISIEKLSAGIYTLQFQGQQLQSMKLIVR